MVEPIATSFNIQYVFLLVYKLLIKISETATYDFFLQIWGFISFAGTILTPLLLVGITYVIIKNYQMRKEEQEHYESLALTETEKETPGTARWQRVLDLVSSERPAEWRQAVLDADVMLDELISEMGYQGDGIGEKLKTIDKSDFRTLDQAWEAHKIRNQVAHGGGDYILTQREARRAIENYKAVFTEFKFV